MGKQINDNSELSDWTFDDVMSFIGADEYALAAQSTGAADSLATEQQRVVRYRDGIRTRIVSRGKQVFLVEPVNQLSGGLLILIDQP